MKRVLIALSAMGVLAACSENVPSGSTSNGVSGATSITNNCQSSTLTAALSDVKTDKFGQYLIVSNLACENQSARVTQELPVNTVQGENPLTIERAYLSTTTSHPSSGYVFVEVTNPTADEIVCPDFNISFLDQLGQVIDFGYGHYLEIYSASHDYRSASGLCIGPGERALLSDIIFSEGDRISELNLMAEPNWAVGTHRPTSYQLKGMTPQQNRFEVQFTLDHVNWAQDLFPFIYLQDANGFFVQQRIAAIDKTRVYLQPEAHMSLPSSTLSGLKEGDKIYFDPDLMQIEQRGLQADFVQTNQ